MFRPKLEEVEGQPEFQLVLSKKMTYDIVWLPFLIIGPLLT